MTRQKIIQSSTVTGGLQARALGQGKGAAMDWPVAEWAEMARGERRRPDDKFPAWRCSRVRES